MIKVAMKNLRKNYLTYKTKRVNNKDGNRDGLNVFNKTC